MADNDYLQRCMMSQKCGNFGCHHITPHEGVHGECGARECEFLPNGKLTICIPTEERKDKRIISIWEE